MSEYSTNPLLKRETATYFGKEVTILNTDNKGWAKIQYEDGRTEIVSKAMLLSTSVFNWKEEQFKRNEEKMDYYMAEGKKYKEQKNELRKELKKILALINDKCRAWGTDSKDKMNEAQQKEYKILNDNKYECRMDIINRGNNEQSCYTSAFMYACDNMKLA